MLSNLKHNALYVAFKERRKAFKRKLKLPQYLGDAHCCPVCGTKLRAFKPIWKSFAGWKCNTYALRKLADLPANARKYIEFIEEYLSIPVAMISTSPERDDTVFYPSFDTLL